MSEWMPIETAPKDGTVIDLWSNSRRLANCFWFAYDADMAGWQQQYAERPDLSFGIHEEAATHWMLPPPPPVTETP